MDETILNNILTRIQSDTMPAGKMTKEYPGVPDSTEEPYITHRGYSAYNTNPQQPIESDNLDEDYGVQTKKGKDLVVDEEEDRITEQGEEEEKKKEESKPKDSDLGPEDKKKPEGGGEETDIGGGGEDESEQFDATEIGRIYELKKIYARLISIESYLSEVEADELIKLRNYLSQGIDLFKTLVYNVDKFTDQLDDIIVLFYKFLLEVYDTIKKYFQKQAREEKKNNKN